MKGISRRHFLKAAGAAATLGFAGSSPAQPDPEICIARWKPAPDPDPAEIARMAAKLTEQAVAALGGMKRFVARGDVVWLKPNIGFRAGPELAANTNPDVVAALVRLCLDAGAKQVKVGDNSCYGVRAAYPASGIVETVTAAGGEMVYLDDSTPKDIDIKGDRLAVWPLFTEIVEADVLINVPVMKNHALTEYSGCMKNNMGVAGGSRHLFHHDMPTCLTDLGAFLKPKLSILDAVRVITKHGPRGGDLSDVKLMGTVVAGTNPIGIDAFGAEQLGLNPAESVTFAKGEARGLGKAAYRDAPLREVEVA